MTEKEVIDAIKYMQEYQTETDKIEAKIAEKGYPQKCYDTISAFANKRGGIIIFGINEHMTDYEIYSLQSYTDGIEENFRTIKRAEFEASNRNHN